MRAAFDEIRPMLRGFCSIQSGPGRGDFTAISLAGTAFLAEQLGILPAEAMALCLEQDLWPLRFARNRGVFSAAEQRRLLLSHAAVIGCGGLGGHVSTLLARAGVGRLTLCDGDEFCESNLNRQLACREDNLGKNKARAVAEEISGIASHVGLTVFCSNLEAANAMQIIAGADIVLDCLDCINTRRLVANTAAEAGIPFVHAAIAGEEGFVTLVSAGENVLEKLYGAPSTQTKEGAEVVKGVPTITPAATAALEAVVAMHTLLDRPCEYGALYHADWGLPLLEVLYL